MNDTFYAMELEQVAALLGMRKESIWRVQQKAIRRLWRNWRRYAAQAEA